ncbi:putative transposase [Vibrio mimicus]|nr:putative transposase [Vibrio mimicus]
MAYFSPITADNIYRKEPQWRHSPKQNVMPLLADSELVWALKHRWILPLIVTLQT